MANDGGGSEETRLEDVELLRRIREGDSSAQRSLFDRYYQRLVAYAGRRMNRQLQQVEPASDIAQSAMKSVLLGIPLQEFRLGEGESLWPLLVTITLNKIRNRGKKHGGPRRDVSRNVAMADFDFLVCRDDAQDRSELDDLVDQLLGQFTARRRKIVELLLNDCRTVEIARQLGVSERTVYNTRQQAIASLKELLEPHCVPD